MPINPKIKQIYDTLKEGGADVGSEKEFNDYFLAKGKDGYNNRKEVFNTLKEGGADTGKSYEEFAGWLGLHAVKPKPATPQHTVQATKPTPAKPVRTQPTRQQKPKDRPMTAAEKASMISNIGGIVRSTQAGMQRTKNMMTYANKKAGLHVEPVKLGQKSNVVETAKQYNPKTGKMQPHYLTEAGNEYDDKVQADMEQTAIDEQKRRELDPVQSQLEEAYSERDRLEEAVSARRKELEDEYNSRSWYQRVLTEMGKAAHSDMDPAATATDPEHMGFEQDEQYMQLMSAIRKNHQTIQTLEDKKNGKMNSFWHSLGTALTNGYTFADGLPEMRDATAILNAQKHINSINRKRQTGQALTKEEAAAEAVLRNTQTDNVVQGTYGSEYGAWGRAGSGMAQSIDFMKDFLLLPGAGSIAKGVAGKVAGIGGKYLAKKAGETAVKATAKAIARATLKATGVVAGAHAAGAVISNTTGIGRTAAKMGQLGAGDVSMDKNGNYKIENQQDLMSAFAEAEREQARENGSEMFGEFIPGGKVLSAAGKKALSKIGLGKISDMLTSIGNKAWYKNYTNLLSKGGYNGIPGEALEEYEGMFFDAITGHADEAVQDFTDPKQQVDIWLGCATMGALMGAVPMGLHIQGYYRYKHGMDRADRTADFRLTPDKWQPLKEQIDQTDNGNMSGFVVDNILNNKKLEPQEKEAAMDYVRNLTKFRGFNIAQVNNADEAARETQEESRQQDNDRQQAYEMGREAADIADTEGDRSDADAIVLRLREAYGEIERVFADDAEMRLAQLEDDPWEVMNDQSLTPDQQDAVAYFVNSKAAMDGLNDAANEKGDNKHDEAARQIELRTNKQSGMIHPATLKVDDRQVYIVSGNVAMFPDGSAVDIHNSSESVIVCDAETGEMKFISPEQIYKVDEPIDPNMELQAADEAIKAEQQVVLGNDTEEVPEQTEEVSNDGVASDVQNENEVNLPQSENILQNNTESEVNLPQNETDAQEPSALNRIPKGDNGEPLLEQTDPETAWDGVVEYMEDADDAQEYVESMVAGLTKDVENAKKAVSKVKPSADIAKFKADKAAARQVQADVEARLDKWMQISNVNKTRKQAERNRINAERAEADRTRHEKAVAELAEQKRIEAEKKAEQETVGTHAVNPKIKEKWDVAPKVVGSADVITLPDGSQLRGHYVLTEAGAATASHDVNNAYKPTEGFPIDENGQSVNDRDYERDEDARKISRSIADNYDSRALQSVTVVDNNGITLSGNGRNIAGELAAKNGTDDAYIDYLREFPQKYGLTAEQVQSMQHPRVHFVPDEVLPYDAATFARFNAQEMKSQSKPEAAVKLGKVVPDNTFGNIVRSLAQYDRLSDFYANEKDANSAIMELVKAGVVNDKQLPELRTGEALSAAGRELLENTLIGKVFQSNPDAVRQIIAQSGIKQSIVMALSEIAHNRTLAGGYDLSEELSKAVDLVARAKHADPDTYKEGMPVSPFGRQQGLFDDELGDSRVTDATTLLLADILNSTKPGDLRKVLATYNAESEPYANGQLDIFSGGIKSKEEILKDINQHFINATPKEQQALVDAAIEERKRRTAEAATSEQSGGNGTTEQTAPVETGSGQPQRGETGGRRPAVNGRASEGESDLAQTKVTAPLSEEVNEFNKPFILSSDGTTAFGEVTEDSGLTAAPIKLSLGENGIDKNSTNHGYGLLHIEAGHGEQIRAAGFSSVEEFVETVAKNYDTIREGNAVANNQTYLLEVSDEHNNTLFIQLSRNGSYWNVNSAGIFRKKYSRRNRKVASLPTIGNSSNTETVEVNRGQTKGVTATSENSSLTSTGKDSKESDTKQEKEEKFTPSPKKADESLLDYAARVSEEYGYAKAMESARKDTDTHPTEAQKEAGNYRKGHIKVDGFDIALENPKGSTRSGKDANGKEWSITMKHDYGYIRGTKGTDGDHIDVYLSDNPTAGNVYVVDQINQQTGAFDEHKVMYGFGSMEEAVQAYRDQYEDGWKVGKVTEVSREEFKKWVDSSTRKTKPFAEYMNIKKENKSVKNLVDEEKDVSLQSKSSENENSGRNSQGTGRNRPEKLGENDAIGLRLERAGRESEKTTDGSLGQRADSEQAEAEKLASEHGALLTLDDLFGLGKIGPSGTESDTYFSPDGYVYKMNNLMHNPLISDYLNRLSLHNKIFTNTPYELVGFVKSGRSMYPVVRQLAVDFDRLATEKEITSYMQSLGFTPDGDGKFHNNEYAIEDVKPKNVFMGKDGQVYVIDAEISENYTHNSEEIIRDDVKPAESSENYTITPTQYTNKKGKTSDMHLVKFNHELSKEEKAAAKAFISKPLAEGRRTPRGWYDREQGGYMVRSEEAAKQLGNMLTDETVIADAQPLTVQDYRNAASPATRNEQEKKPANTVTVEDAAIQDVEAKVYNPEQKNGDLEFNGDVSKEDFNDALKDLRSLLGVSDDEGDMGILFRDDDELTKEQRKKIKAAGLSVTQVLVDNGIVKFPDYAGKMVSLIGDKIRPWLKSFYEGVRWEPGYESVDFTPSEEVARFDVQNFDKPSPDILKQAEMVVAEQKAAKISKQTEQEVKSERNEKRKEYEKQTEANTAAIAEEAGTVASEARVVAKRATTGTEVRVEAEKVDATLEKVNNQLALLGYYEADKVEKDFNEAYGNMRNAEKKAVKDATELAKRLADNLGIDIYEATHTALGKNGKRKSQPLATANIAPIGGDISIHLPIQDGKDLSIYINLKTTGAKGSFVQGDNLEVGNIMYRIENPNATGNERYGNNNFATPDITYNELLDGISSLTGRTMSEADKELPANSKLLAQYNALKSKHPDAKLLFRVGDFYKTYQDDAEAVANTLGIVLTKRNDGVNMAGFPYHALDTYLPKLIRAGYRVAICDQLEMPKETEKVVPMDTPQPKKVNVESLVRELQEKGKARLSDHAEEVKEKSATPNLHGFNIGDKVMYKGKEATLYDTDNGRPVLDAGLAPVMYEVTDWDKLTPISSTTETTPAKEEKTSTEKEKPIKKNNSKKKSVSLKREPTVGDLFGDLFSNNNLDGKDNDTTRTQQAERSSRENGSVGSISADRDGVLDTRSTGGTDRGETARVSDTTGTVADGERKEVPGQRGGRTTSGGNHGDGEAERPLPERGQRIGDRDDADERSAVAGVTDESQRTTRPAADTSDQLVHGEARRGRNVASAKLSEPKFKRNYLYPNNSSEIDNMTPQQRLRSNVEALEVVRTLMKEGREATEEEREKLGRYRGWGGVDLGRAYSTDMMRRSTTGRWGAQTENDKLLSHLADIIDDLDPNGERGVLSGISRAALTSYYTPTAVAKVMNGFVEQAGFKGGNMLDPSMGSGVFEGTMSKYVQQRTMIHGIELDWLTGQIARNLYPDANVLVTGYEQAGTADNAYDVVMSNIPFGDLSVTDKTWKHDSSPVRKAAQNRIHNYFAVKMLDNTRPGGLCIIMTSNAISDTKSNQIIREHLADQAEVLGVVRLPDNTFKGAGTSVVTDVIFLRKFKDEADRTATHGNEAYTANIEKPFLSSGDLQLKNPTDGKTYKVSVNGYFAKNKDMMIGDGKAGGQYRADEFGLSSTMGTDDIAKAMGKLVEKKIVGDRKGKLFDTHKTEREVKQAVSEAYKGDGNYISSGNIVEQDGMIGVVTSTKNRYGDVTTTFTEMPSLKGKADRIRAMFPVRKAMKQLIDMQIQGEKEHNLSEARAELQNAYDDFVKKYSRLNDKGNDFLTEDIDGYTLRSLEKYDDGKFVGLSDIFTKNTIKPALDLTTAKTPQDAIGLSLAEYGEINPSFMEEVLGDSWAEQCGETLFKTPFTEDEYETADAYLSGDVKTKLEQARAAVKEDASLQRNVEALEAIQPKDIPFEDISIRMGARWIPAEVYTDFMYEQFGIQKYEYRNNKSGVEYMPEVDQYVVNVANNELGGEADAWRTSRRSASEVFTAALQDKSLSVFDTIKEGGKETKVLNKEETELLNNKIQDLRTAFEDWIGQQPEREEKLMRLYNDKFNRTVLRKFDGSHLNVAGLMGKELRPHQKDAVWMLINNRGGIVDHIVGAGKTLVMQSAIMEMRRMGIAKKPMIIALKSTVAQIAKEFREAYPAARILAPTEKDFAANNRKKFMAQIALNDYDCVILSHDQYCMLPHTEEVERSVIDEQMAQLDNAIEFLYGQEDKSQLTKKQIKGLEKRKNNLETKLTNLLDRKIDREFTFEGLGVDYLFVDECQHFKSLPYVSTYDRIAGLGDKKGSQKAIALLNGVRYLQKMHQGDQGTVFLSGTTISNSLSEIYHLLNYLRPSEMERLGMTTFDAWAGNFAIHTAELEYGVTSELKEKDRFRSLTNIPELAKMYAEIADVRNDLNLKLPKPKMRSHIVTVPQTDLMQEINREIVNMVKSKDGSYFNIASNDNTPWGLLASTLSAKAAINPRLIDESWEAEGGKIPAVCENVKKIYNQFAEQKGTQLIFCDTGVPGKGKKYDAYTDIINRLVNDYGIPRKEIADIHVANTDEKRKELFAKVNDGSVRILIGGTKNMGTGVNVQKRIVAMHHVDVPWTPADREQREGRGVRQGNEIARDFNDDNVDVYFYATEGSLDMYKYQLQETKGKLFAQFKSGTIGDRTFDEGDAEGDFDPAEVVAMLSGNPVIFEKSKQDKKVEKLRRAKRAYESDWQRRHARYDELQTKKSNFERLLSLNADDVRELERGGFTPDAEGKYPTTVTVSVKDNYSSRKTFDKPKEAGAYIHELLKQGKKVQLSGFHQTANISIPVTDAGLFGKPVAELESYGGIKYTVEVSDDDTAAGVSFRNLLQKVYNNRKVYERNIEDVNNQLKGADPGENAFPKQAELDEALKEKKRLDEEYKKLSDEEEKPSDSDDTRYRYFDEEVNEQFNRELAELTEGNADTKIFNLGSPSSILLSAGVEDKPMKLYGNKVIKKMKRHGFALAELKDLPRAVADPIAVFDNYQREGNRSILTELRTQQGNFLVSVNIGKDADVDFNIVRSVFGKGDERVVDWINNGLATYINKEKALSFLSHQSAPIAATAANAGQGSPSYQNFSERGISEAAENSEISSKPQYNSVDVRKKLISAAKIVKDFVNPVMKGENLSRDGAGTLSDDELSMNNDPVAKMLGKSTRTARQRGEFADRQRKSMTARVMELAATLHLDNVKIVTDVAELSGKRARSKGFYNPQTGVITIVIPNHRSVQDVEQTLLHEAVAHYGLRKLFGEHFDTFLKNVYEAADEGVRRRITDLALSKYRGNFHTATEEYLASLAETTDFEHIPDTFWGKIKRLFLEMLHMVGFDGFAEDADFFDLKLSDNELRYILWRSYENLKEPGRYRSILGEAADVAKQAELKVGNYAENSNSDKTLVAEDLFRDGDSVEYRKAQARNLYEQRVSRGLYQMQEAIQDSMLGLKEAMEAILKAEGGYTGKIEDVAGYENPYLGENRLSSVNQAECSAFAQTLFKPMLEEVAKLAKTAKTAKERAELTDYMMAKHGLERNNVMARRAAEKVAHDEFWKELRTAERTAANDPLDQDAADVLVDVKQRMQDRENELYSENRSSDYAGLTALTGKDDVADAESEAEQMVSDYEADHDTTDLWDKVNAVTKATLQKTYECGIISKATYDDISDMYEHYIPLRGFDEKTSDEAYAYLSDKHSAFNAPIKTAKGRKSKADDPFANMEAMAESAIMQGNRNMLVKRKFMRFAQNHPSDLVSISDLWLRYDDVTDEWKPVNAGDVKGTERIEEDDTPREVERKMRDFEEKMRQLSESDPDHFKRQKDHPEIPYRVIGDRDLRQHQVLVKQGGKDYVLTINGNPRAAQALNGQTNPDNDMSGALGAILHYGEVINRQLSAFYTTRNPDFVVSNFMRDMLYANTMVWVKESPNYALRFHKNFGKVNPAKMKVLLAKLRNGTLDMNDETEKAFSLFMANGGETGYSNIRDIEQRKNDIRRELSKHNGKLPIRKAWSLLGERLDEYNRAVENCARFAAFMTSRQMKRSIDRSVYDAKEISVNFNKKGSGAKFMRATGQTKSGNAAAFVSGLGRSSYVFWNAAIQGTTNFGRQFKHHPGKALAGAAAMFLLGALVADIAGDDGNDDSKNSYYNLPEYVRRSNVIFRLPGMEETWISIPLPVEYRALYGMGELMTSTISGKEHYTSGELASQIASQVSQALPIDFMEGGGGFKAFVPSAVKPYAEVMTNKSWTGMPIYKDTPWNKDMPEWTKAYKSANKQLVGFSKLLNEISGGDTYTSGVIDINPAQVEYLLNGYFGGVSSTIDKFAKMGETALGQREYDPRSFLILNRLVKSGDERTEYRHINNEYFRLKQEHDKLKARLKHYEEDTYNGVFDYAEKINWLNKSPEYQRLEIFEDYSSDINAINKELKEPMNDNERKELEKELYGLKKKLVDEANKTRK